MINFLKDVGISGDTITLIEQNNSSNELYDLYCNQDECLKIIELLKKMEINNIDKLLIYEIELFYNVANDVLKCFSNYDVNRLAQAINNDYTIIEKIIL